MVDKKTINDYDQIAGWIAGQRKAGLSDQQIMDQLRQNGWNEGQLKGIFRSPKKMSRKKKYIWIGTGVLFVMVAGILYFTVIRRVEIFGQYLLCNTLQTQSEIYRCVDPKSHYIYYVKPHDETLCPQTPGVIGMGICPLKYDVYDTLDIKIRTITAQENDEMGVQMKCEWRSCMQTQK